MPRIFLKSKGPFYMGVRIIFAVGFGAFFLLRIKISHIPKSGTEWEKITYRGKILEVKRSSITGLPVWIRGIGKVVSNYGYTVEQLNAERLNQVGKKLAEELKGLTHVSSENLIIRITAREHGSGKSIISYWEVYKGILVFQTSFGFVIEPDGTIDSVGMNLFIVPDDVPSKNIISTEKAIEIAKKSLHKTDNVMLDNLLPPLTRLLIYPSRKSKIIKFHLAFAINLFLTTQSAGWAYFVDAITGEVIHRDELLAPLSCCY